MKRVVLFFLVLALVAGVSHFVWESSHVHLYTDYEKMEGFLPVTVFATLGDIMYTLLAAGLFVLLRGYTFIEKTTWQSSMTLAITGLLIALFVEQKAMLEDKWEYTDAMPIVYGFGLSPLIQMSVLLPLCVYLSVRLVGYLQNRDRKHS